MVTTRILTATVVGLATIGLALGSATAQQHDAHHPWGTVGSDVSLTACVERGQLDDTLILTRVADVPVHPATMGRVVYWLDDVDELDEHIGRQIRIRGKIEKVEQSEMEVKAGDDNNGGWYVEIEGPGQDVHAAPETLGVRTAGREDEEDDIKTTLVRLDVQEITMTATSCPAR